jgi:hypothetical protein
VRVASAGQAARVDLRFESIPIFLDVSIRSGADYGVTITSSDIRRGDGLR